MSTEIDFTGKTPERSTLLIERAAARDAKRKLLKELEMLEPQNLDDVDSFIQQQRAELDTQEKEDAAQ